MKDVGWIILKVYGRQQDAAKRFGVGQPAIANWVARGYLPPRWQVAIYKDARKKRLGLTLDEIPITAEGVAA